jgi:large conductance mechanosensitive channel
MIFFDTNVKQWKFSFKKKLLSLNYFINIKKNKTMGMISEFKAFAMKGNVVDLAIGVIIGGAFGKIVSSFIDDVLTPLLLKPALEAANLSKIEELTIFGGVKYGMFLSAVINFVIIAFVLFMLIKGMNASKKKEEVATVAPAGPTQEELLTQIRDLLKK